MSTDLTIVAPGALPVAAQQHGALVSPTVAFLQRMEENWRLAVILTNGGLIPQKSPEQALTVMLQAQELGLGVMAGFKNIHPIPAEGGGMRLTFSADLVCAIASRDHDVTYEVLESTDALARMVFRRPGWKELTVSFSFEQANAAGLTGKNNWKKWPAAMLLARCKMIGIRTIDPQAAAGLYDADELGADTDANGAPTDTSWEYAPSERAAASTTTGSASQPAPAARKGPAPKCPDCGGPMWDNREKNVEKNAERARENKRPLPDFKCKKREGCNGAVWAPEETPAAAGEIVDEWQAEWTDEIRMMLRQIGRAELTAAVESKLRVTADRAALDKLRGQVRRRFEAAEAEKAEVGAAIVETPFTPAETVDANLDAIFGDDDGTDPFEEFE